ncbi:MAG: GAF domain-containing protein [Okeania sp. SIO3H1]|uniref:ATP-binding protein n=1 Tax=Okeania sp. SIO1I7 TaxID=2607772 RepID=UPI0013CAB8FB|nr:ATP-binding protein [Okeania sp. SIO1I7]NEN87704.1 GAF domain-containing protein [Okeania sp. SIO3H1]NET24704.1 GAF domain-containing protein [Okeania sp. SIO1I7]
MWELLKTIFSPTQYMPHGSCYLWQTSLVWLHLLSDLLIAIAYFSITAILLYFACKRKNEVPFLGVFILFGAFITLCGFGHLLEVWTLWHPAYWFSGVEQALTALVSCYTALQMAQLLPQFLALKTPEQLEAVNLELQHQIVERQQAEQILQNIVVATSSVTGEEFFPALVENLAKALDVTYVIVSERINDSSQLKTLAIWGDGKIRDNIEYNFLNLPCGVVINEDKLLYYPQKIQKSFPEKTILQNMKAESYLGVPLLDENQQIIGVLCVINNKSLANEENIIAMVRVFAARATSELLRQRAEIARRYAYDELENRVQEATEGLRLRTAELVEANAVLETEIQEKIAAGSAIKDRENRLKKQQTGLLKLAKSQNLYEGNLQAALQEITELGSHILQVEKTSVWFYNEDQSELKCADLYQISTTKHSQENTLFARGFPLSFQDVNERGMIPENNMDMHLNAKAKLVDYFAPISVSSTLNIPINFQGKIIGFICLDNNGNNRHWEVEEQNFGSYLAYMTALAMESRDRLQAELTLRQKNQELATTLQQLQTAQQELIQSEKMVALGQLVAGVAHEINTPLGAINSSINSIANFWETYLEKLPIFFKELSPERQEDFFALLKKSNSGRSSLSTREQRQIKRNLVSQLKTHLVDKSTTIANYLVGVGVYDNLEEFLPLLRDSNSEEILKIAYQFANVQTSSQTIRTAAERAAKVVFALKTYARYDFTGEKITANILEGIETVLTLYHNKIKHGVEVIKEFDNSLPPIQCYPDELNQVWTNLIHNALQAMEYDGSLTIQATQSDADIKVSITDSGNGIPPEIMSKIFQPFFTTKPPGEGSGLGLDIVKKIIEKHDGKIEVTSLPDQTTFIVYLPINTVEIK